MSDSMPGGLATEGVGDAVSTRPVPRRLDRWQPLRSGLLNLYRYEDDEFRFEDGRLLLRGDNGSGKSRVLALQLPFLLDGDVSPSRVEPDGDPAKRIEWHLLMGRWPDRTGYTWIEFGRRLPDGGEAFVTLGCGMRAVAGHSGLHGRWFFVTSRRVGMDFSLQSADRRPHGRDRLEEALAGVGRVFTQAEEYRKAVDETLFGLGSRYDRLVELLIRLRRPKLSQKLDEEELSATLGEALPVLPVSMVEEVAEAFRGLESDRDALRGYVETGQAVDDFLREYRVYARIAVRRRAGGVRSTHSSYEVAQRALRDAERRMLEASARLEEIGVVLARLEREHAAAEEAARTLRASPEMRTVAELEHAEQGVRAAEKAERTAAADADSVRGDAARARELAGKAEQQHAAVTGDVEAAMERVRADARTASMTAEHEAQFGGSTADRVWEASGFAKRAESAMDRALRKRNEAIDHLKSREREVSEARRAWEIADAARQRAADAGAAALKAERLARGELELHATEFRAAHALWCRRVVRLPMGGTFENLDELSSWIETRDGVNPWRARAEAVYRRSLDGIRDRMADRRRDLERDAQAIGVLEADLERLRLGAVEGPPVLPGRRSDRTDRPGAPLWRSCDFRADVSEAIRAGIEAALEASGLLDAWLLPDGRLVTPTTEDSFLRGESAGPDESGEGHLGRWLVPARDPGDPMQAEMTDETIERVLRRIGGRREVGVHWVDPDGDWRLGPLSGRWSKPQATYVGAGSREAARRRRIESVERDISLLEGVCEVHRREIRSLEREASEADAEWAAFPEDRSILEAGIRLGVATRSMVEAYEAHERAERVAAEKRLVHEGAQNRYWADAADVGLREWCGRLDELTRATSEYEKRVFAVWPAIRHWHASAERRAIAVRQREDAETAVEERSARHQSATEALAAAASRHETLRAMHGATVATVLENLGRVEGEIVALRAALRERRAEQTRFVETRAAAEADTVHARAEQERHEKDRRLAIEGLEGLATQRLLAEAHDEFSSIEPGPWTVTRSVEISRQIEVSLVDTEADEASWRRRQDSIHVHVQELRDRLLARNHQPETHQVEDLILVRCQFQARTHTMTELRAAFVAEVTERERLLEAREREIIENHLLGEVAVELQRLVRGAEEWIASANRELAARPTSTGLRFRFLWEVAMEGAFGEVRKAFLKTSELWSPDERSGITRFLQERIRAEQIANEQGSWRDHLGVALDYRRWHRFVVERQQDGTWRRLDRRTYGTGSGGEKALALTLPRFAAAAAHYRSARPEAPRLVMLDEAFAGIDPTMRSQCMGMLAQFDLDVMMTSEQEWGCYPTVPGLAIHHLTTRPGIDAVAATVWIWNGSECRRADAEPAAVRSSSTLGTGQNTSRESPG